MANKTLFSSTKSRLPRADAINEAGGRAYQLAPKHALAQIAATRCFNGIYYREDKPTIVMHDKDSEFTKTFVEKLKSRGVRTNSLPKASPNLNGRCERFVGTIKWECLSRFIIFGKRHLDYLVSEFAEYHNTTRSSMVRDHLPTVREQPEEVVSLRLDKVEVRSHVGGLVKSFARRAAYLDHLDIELDSTIENQGVTHSLYSGIFRTA